MPRVPVGRLTESIGFREFLSDPFRTIGSMSAGPATYARSADTAITARAQLDEAAAMAATFADTQRQLVATLIGLWPTAAWLAAGVRSAKAWLLAYTPLSYHEAHRLEHVAGLCARHGPLADAVTSGAMPVKRAATLARFATPERQPYLDAILPALLELNANTTDDDAFTTGVRYWADQVDQQLRPRTPHPHSLALSPSLFGGGEIYGQFAPAAFANICAAITGWIQDPDPADAPYQRTFRERQADALDDLCAASLTGAGDSDIDDDLDDDDLDGWRASDTFDGTTDTDDLDAQLAAADTGHDITDLDALRRRLRTMEQHRRRRARRRTRIRSGATINAIIDVRTLLGLRDDTDLEDLVLHGDGWHLTRELLERLVCDSGLLATIFDGPTKILDANPRTEQFTPTQRRALAARDRCCTFPGCRRPPRHCDAHHLHHRTHGGPTTTANGALLCRFHHRLIHEYGWQLHIHDNHWTATDRHGHTWTGRPAPPDTATATAT